MADKFIDINSIENYENATVEELKAFIEGFKYDNGEDEINRYKTSNSKANSKVAELTKQLREKMTDEERLKVEQDEKYAELENRLNEVLERNKGLENERQIASLTASYISLGYPNELASAKADAVIKGDRAKELEIEKQMLTTRDQRLKDEMLKSTPIPPAGNPSPSVTKDTFSKMSTEEQMKFISENPDWTKIIK